MCACVCRYPGFHHRPSQPKAIRVHSALLLTLGGLHCLWAGCAGRFEGLPQQLKNLQTVFVTCPATATDMLHATHTSHITSITSWTKRSSPFSNTSSSGTPDADIEPFTKAGPRAPTATVGATVATTAVGAPVTAPVGAEDGDIVADTIGAPVGAPVGAPEGAGVGAAVRAGVGAAVGADVVGASVVGAGLGAAVDSTATGAKVGAAVDVISGASVVTFVSRPTTDGAGVVAAAGMLVELAAVPTTLGAGVPATLGAGVPATVVPAEGAGVGAGVAVENGQSERAPSKPQYRQ